MKKKSYVAYSLKQLTDEMARLGRRPEDVFLSEEFRNWLERLANNLQKSLAAINRKKCKPLKVVIHQKGFAPGWTDGDVVNLAVGDDFFTSEKDLTKRFSVILGVFAHELGHVFATNFTLHKGILRKMNGGEMPQFPDVPEKVTAEKEMSCDDIYKRVLTNVLHDFDNILEDGYIERYMLETFPENVLSVALKVTRLKQLREFPRLSEFEGHTYLTTDGKRAKWHLFQALRSIALCHAKYDVIKGNEGDVYQAYTRCMDDVAKASIQKDSTVRKQMVFQSFYDIFDIIDDYVKDVVERAKAQAEQLSEIIEIIKDLLEKELPKSSAEGDGISIPIGDGEGELNGLGGGDKNHSDKGGSGGDNGDDSNDGNDDGGNSDGDDGPSPDLSDLADALNGIMNQIAKKNCEKKAEEEREKELNKKAKDLCSKCKTPAIEVTRGEMPTEEDKQAYDEEFKDITRPARKTAEKLKDLLEQMSFGDTERFLILGKKLDAQHINDPRERRMKSDIAPEFNDLAAAILVDESGSMHGERIRAARKAAATLLEFCRICGIPIGIWGHTSSWGDALQMFEYTTFDRPLEKDKYRLLQMSARCGNRDGSAVEYVAMQLAKRPESQKLLFVISDGLPSDYKSDEDGIKHTSSVVNKYRRGGMMVLAAAIGDDKEQIARIYGKDFLDIANLDALPKKLYELIRKYMIV